MNTFTAMLLFFGVVFLLVWLAGPPTGGGPFTGRDCVEVVDRLWKQRGQHSLTPAEEADMEMCRQATRKEQRMR